MFVRSLGVDTYSRDPITEFCITLETYPEIGRTIAQIERPTLFVMEGKLLRLGGSGQPPARVALTKLESAGGYCMDAIGGCVRSVLAGFQEEAHELAELAE